jgi:Tol biopolymer transport system component
MPQPRTQKLFRLLLASLFALSISVPLLLKFANRPPRSSMANFANSLQTFPFTKGPELEDEPALSPACDKIAFTSDRAGNPDIWIKDIAAGETINLTSDCVERDDSPRWSPDGKMIAFRSDREGGGIFVADLASRAAKRIAPWGGQPAWSPDGKQIAYKIDKPPIGKKICAIAVAGGSPRLIFATEKPEYISALAWSHDGQWLAFAFGSNMAWNIYVKSVAGDEIFQATDDTYFNSSPAWAEHDNAIFFRSDRGGVADVWVRQIALDRRQAVGEAMPVTFGAELRMFDVVESRRMLVYSKIATRTNIFALDLSQPNQSQEARLRKITNWERSSLDPNLSPDGSKILFTSNVEGKLELWRCDRDGRNPRVIYRPNDSSESAIWSPDGKQIAYIDGDGDEMELWMMNLANGEKKQLTKNNYVDMKPDWSPDGKWIVYTAKIQEGELIAVSAVDDETRRLTFHPASDAFPKFSPDGKTIAFSSDRNGFQNIWLLPFAGGEPQQLTFDQEAGGLGMCWSPDGQFIYHVAMQSGVRNIWKVAVNGKYREQITDYRYATHNVHRMTSLATDGRELFFAVQERTGDLWLMKPR